MNEHVDKYFTTIGQHIYDAIPEFKECWFRIELIDDVCAFGLFFKNSKDEICYLNEGLSSIEDLFRKMREEFKSAGKEPFSQATFYLRQDGKFSIDFGYEDVSDFGLSGERREAWIEKTFGKNAEVKWN